MDNPNNKNNNQGCCKNRNNNQNQNEGYDEMDELEMFENFMDEDMSEFD